MAWPGTRYSVKKCCGCAAPPTGCGIVESAEFRAESELEKYDTSGSVDLDEANGLLNLGAGGRIITKVGAQALTDPQWVRTHAKREGGDPAEFMLVAGYKDINNFYWGKPVYDVAGNLLELFVGRRINGNDDTFGDGVTAFDDTEAAERGHYQFCLIPPQPREPTSEITNVTPLAGTVEGVDAPELLACDGVTADFGLSNVTPTKGCSVLFPADIVQPGSTIDGIEFGVKCSATQSQTITGSISVTAGGAGGSGPAFVVPATLASFGGGSPTTNFGATAADVNSGMAVSASFTRDTGPAADVVSVDCFGLTIYYTTPDKTRGRVTLSYMNMETGATPQFQCVTAEFDEELTGKKAGIIDNEGSWSFTDFSFKYHYSADKPECPRCTCDAGSCIQCCADDLPPSKEYSLDLTAFDLQTPDEVCATEHPCEGITGVVVIGGDDVYQIGPAPLALLINGTLPCNWEMQRWMRCDTLSPLVRIRYHLSLTHATTPPYDCQWTLLVEVISAVAFVTRNLCSSAAIYVGELASDQDCQTMPVVLNKVDEFRGGDGVVDCCTGDFPDSIVLDIP